MEDITRRLVIKRQDGVPTIPVSLDHRNGDWLSTDIYEGELYQDKLTGRNYTRTGSTITNPDGSKVKKFLKGLLEQSGTSAPVLTILESTLSGTPTMGYTSAGLYTLTLTGEFTLAKTFILLGGTAASATAQLNCFRASANALTITSQTVGAVATNGLLSTTSILIEVYP